MREYRDREKLLELARAGDQNSLAMLLDELTPELRRRVAAKMDGPWRSLIDEDDILQVTFIEACTRLEKFTGGGSNGFLAWLTRLADNNRIDAVRSLEGAKRPAPSKRVQPRTNDDSASVLVELISGKNQSPSRSFAQSELKVFLDGVLEKLPTEYEQVIRLYDLMGKTATEVAAEMGRSEGAIYMLRARAHERLKDVIDFGDSQFRASLDDSYD